MSETQALATATAPVEPESMSSVVSNEGVFGTSKSFELAQRMATALAKSSVVPATYQNNIPNCLVAMEMAQRTGTSVLMIMQNMHVIQGRPSFSASFIIAAINSCGRFDPLQFEMTGKDKEYGCKAWTTDKAGDRLEGPKVTMLMAEQEGWINKNGSKWKTMPELMLRYRAAAFFGRLFAPDIIMGMHSVEEVETMTPIRIDTEVSEVFEKINEAGV